VLHSVAAQDEQDLAIKLAQALKGHSVSEDAEARRQAAEREMDQAKTAVKHKREEIKRQRLRGVERQEAIEREVGPLERDYQEKRARWVEALRDAVPRPELALGKHIADAGPEDYRELARSLLDASDPASREALDFLAAFGSDACARENRGKPALDPTLFQFTTGSGHQYFLQDVRQLTEKVSPEAVFEVLFRPWTYRDEGLSLRWDPIEDRRYALSDRDPSGEKARTVWMANLLAYRALALFPTAPRGRRLGVAGWIRNSELEAFSWPLWEYPAALDTVRSVIQLADLAEDRPDTTRLRARGIAAVYRARRIEVGQGNNKKINFAPARQL
jgi:hypothetical protein